MLLFLSFFWILLWLRIHSSNTLAGAMVTVCNWQHASHNALTVKNDDSMGHSPMHLHRYWWFLIARSWGLFALVAHTMQDEYETHSCFSREASIELRECQSMPITWAVDSCQYKNKQLPKKNPRCQLARQLAHQTTGAFNHSEAGIIQNHSFFSTSTFDGRVPGTLGSHDPALG